MDRKTSVQMDNIVVVNGFFDPIHEGHVDLFSDASEYGKVYALVNSNEMAIQKKGFYFMHHKARCHIVGAMRNVTIATIIQDEEQWERTMRAVHPDYFFCSGDKQSMQDVDDLVKNVCDDIGCGIVFGKRQKVNSSSELLGDYEDMVINNLKEHFGLI